MARELPASGLFSDDYGVIKKSIFYPRGEFFMGGVKVDRQNQWGGLVYPLMLTPWKYVDSPFARHQAIFFINSLLALATSLVGSYLVYKIAGSFKILPTLAVFVFPAVFLFTFVAMTENAFHLVALLPALPLSFLCRDGQGSGSKRFWISFLFLVALTFFATLTRISGLAISAGVAVALFLVPNWSTRSKSIAALFVLGTNILIYKLGASLVQSAGAASRESAWVSRLLSGAAQESALFSFISIILHQIYYICLSVAVFPLGFVLLHLMTEMRKGRKSEFLVAGENAVLQVYLMSSAVAIFLLSALQISEKYHLEVVSAVYGRYGDTVALLVLIWGLGLAFSNRVWQETRLGAYLLVFVFMFFGLIRVYGWTEDTINQAGWYAFLIADPSVYWGIVALLVLSSLSVLIPGKLMLRVSLLCLVVFSVWTIKIGYQRAQKRAQLVYHSLEVGEHIQSLLPVDTCISIDRKTGKEKAPGSIKRMSDVYRALYFLAYPRSINLAATAEEKTRCPYYFYKQSLIPESDWEPLWTNGDYVLYKLRENSASIRSLNP